MKDIQTRFWEKVILSDNTECWEWTGSKLRGGYGGLNINNRTVQAHRLSYEMFVGKIPKGLLVCHKCDNPSCVNPKHLFLGTHQDNATDKVNKGRMPKGEDIGNSKLTLDDVNKIRKLINEKVPRRKIAKMFGIGSTCVTDIATGRTWSWAE
jgi:HNH endonuclease